jgi:hypothetical protein
MLQYGDAPSLKGIDIEDITSTMRYENKEQTQRPFIATLAIFDGQNFLTDQQIQEQLRLLASMYPAGQQFVLRVQTKQAMNMASLNERLAFVLAHLPKGSTTTTTTSTTTTTTTTSSSSSSIPFTISSPLLLVESSVERLELLSQLPDSVFLSPVVYPALRIFAITGEESEAIEQLTHFIECMNVCVNASKCISASMCTDCVHCLATTSN